MRGTISEVMAPDPVCMPMSSTARSAAAAMRDAGIGDVIVLDGDNVCGIVTDRDIVVRVVAAERQPESVTLGDICSRAVATLSPSDSIQDAVQVMADRALRRLPVVDAGRPVGIVSLGDLAVAHDPQSALAAISGAPPNV
jgi:CBS domain-containing protein